MGVEQDGKIVKLVHPPSGSTAEIYLFGATVTSWKVNGQEKLFVSSKSALDSSKPVSPDAIPEIRGGIPIVFPIFGPPPEGPPEYAALKQHGFARTADWTLESVVLDSDAGVSVRFAAPPPPSTFTAKYKLAYVVTLSATELSTDLHITNTGSEDFIFQALLHNYLAVPDASKLSITGVDAGIRVRDKAKGGIHYDWTGEPVTVKGEIDSVFHKVPSQDLKLDYGNGAGVDVRFRGFEDVTIWNPQEVSGANMADMEAGGWDRYVCIEPGYVREFKSIKPGEEFIGQQVLKSF